MMSRLWWARVSFLALFGAAFMPNSSIAGDPEKVTEVEGITEYRLGNGFRFLLFPDNSKPLVTVNMTVFVGSRHEGYGEAGMAHLLEHMLFKGCKNFPNVPKVLADHGARFNGTTWLDRTNYYETMPASDDNLEFGLQLEADRLVTSFIAHEELAKEMNVVCNEFERGENNPQQILSQRMMSAAFNWHNYGKSTIGNRSDIERVPIENLQAFYRKFYQIDNCMLIVAGKFDRKKAIEFIQKYFGSLKKPARDLPNTYTEEPAQDGERHVVLRRVGTIGAVGAIYHIPAGAHEDYPAIEILEDTLTLAPSGRIYKALVESKKATSVKGTTYALHDPGIIEISATVEGNNVEDARETLVGALESLSKTPITEVEVDRSKTRFGKFHEQLMSASDRLAIQLSEWAAAGDWRMFFLHRDRIEKVTAADVNAVAAKYLTRNNRTVGAYYPAEKAERATIPATPVIADLVKDYKGRAVVAAGEDFDVAPASIEKRVQRGEIEGIPYALLQKKTRGEMVQMRLNLRFGSEKSLQDLATPANLLGPLMRRGTTFRVRQQLTDALDKLGAQLALSSDAGGLSVSLQVKKADLPAALKIVGEILRSPSLPQDELDLLKRESLEGLNEAKTDPESLAANALRRQLAPYPKDNIRYVPTIEESIARLDAVKLDDVKRVYAQIGADHGELAIIGDIDRTALAAVGQILKDWHSPVPYERIDRSCVSEVKGNKEAIQTPDKENAVYLAGLVKPLTDSDPDYPALVLGNYMLGGAPLASRLSNRVRGEKGLSYGVRSMFGADAKDKSGRVVIYAITHPKNMGKVNSTIAEEVDKFLKEGVSASELDEAKKGYLESLKVGRSNDSALAGQLASCIYDGRTYSFYGDLEKKILGLEPSEVKAAFQKFLDPSKLVIIQAGDFNKK